MPSGSAELVVEKKRGCGCGQQTGEKKARRDANWAQGARPWVTDRLGDAECKKERRTRLQAKRASVACISLPPNQDRFFGTGQLSLVLEKVGEEE